MIEKKLLEFEADGREIANFLRSLEQFIQTVKGQMNFMLQIALLTYFMRFFIYNKLEQFRLEKKYWVLETFRKS